MVLVSNTMTINTKKLCCVKTINYNYKINNPTISEVSVIASIWELGWPQYHLSKISNKIALKHGFKSWFGLLYLQPKAKLLCTG